jgi:hypothetical protein
MLNVDYELTFKKNSVSELIASFVGANLLVCQQDKGADSTLAVTSYSHK